MRQATMAEYIEDRLRYWALWFNRIEDNGLGFPSCSIEARMAETGGVVIKGHWPKQTPTNASAEEIENLVHELHKQSPRTANALREQYLKRGTLKVKAMRLNVSRAQFTVEVEMGRRWLAGHVTAQNRSRSN